MYIITLIGKSFKTLMAIAIQFNLKILQYNVVNTFINTLLNKMIYIRIPVGHKEKGKILHLYKVLYRLKKSPLLWQRYFKSNLIKMGFSTVPHKPYYIIKGGIFIFFYINNIIFIFQKNKIKIIKGVVRKLKTKYQFTNGGKF